MTGQFDRNKTQLRTNEVILKKLLAVNLANLSTMCYVSLKKRKKLDK